MMPNRILLWLPTAALLVAGCAGIDVLDFFKSVAKCKDETAPKECLVKELASACKTQNSTSGASAAKLEAVCECVKDPDNAR